MNVSANITMIEAATAETISNVFVNNNCAAVTLQITGSYTSATVLVEGLVNLSSNAWVSLGAIELGDFELNSDGLSEKSLYQIGIEGIPRVRVHVTAVSGGDITVVCQFGNAVIDPSADVTPANLTPITAYDMAVAGGYTGTKAQFETDMGNSATNATNAAASASAAAASATTASNAAANFAPAYSSSATYAVGDHVLYNGGYYVCNTAITTAEAWTAAHWTAVKVGPEITDLKTQLNRRKTATPGYILTATNEGNGTEWSPVGLPTDAQTEEAVSNWLDEHPEATTTVQDESLTEAKFSDALKLKTIKDYVTPEMYGAKGDGTTDDTEAIQSALNSGKAVLFAHDKTYRAENLIAPERTIINGNLSTIKALTTNNTILTINRDSSIENLILAGIDGTHLAPIGLKFSSAGYRIHLSNIKIVSCEYGVKDSNGIWSVDIGKIWFLNCENCFYIDHASTSISISNFLHENCGSPLYWQYVLYSHIGVLCGDYANGGEESSWPYGTGHGARNKNVYSFFQCKAISIDTMAGENNIGKYFVEIGSSDVSISTINVSRHTSFEENNRCLIKIREEISRVNIGAFMYYPNSEDAYTIFTDYYDFPYNISTYGYSDGYLLRTVTGKISDRTPTQIIEPNNSKKPIRSNYSIYTDSISVSGKNALQLLFGYTVNRYTPLRLRIEIVMTNNASVVKLVKGEIDGVILSNGVLGGLAVFTVQDPLSAGGQPQDLTVTKENSKYTIELPTGMIQAWITVESFCPRTEYEISFIATT